MSNAYAGERTVPTLLLIVFIVLILIFGVSAYVIYTEQARVAKDLDTARTTGENDRRGLAAAVKDRDDLYAAIGFDTLAQIDEFFEAATVQVEPKKLETLIAEELKKREELVKKIGVDPRDADDTGKSKFLEQTITAARRGGVVPDSLKGSTVGNLIEQHIRLDKAVRERADFVTQGDEAVKAADRSLVAKKDETKTKFADLDAQALRAWDERVVEENRVRLARPAWDAEREALDQRLAVEQAVNQKLEARLKVQKDMATPLDGVILSYDWRARRGTVNLGAENRVKAGYEFDVYTVRPGGDAAENRVYRGKIRLLNVGPEASLFAVIPSDWENEDRPIMEGQRVGSQIYDNTRRRTFCLQGWFPEGGDHSKQALAGMIFRAGGVVQDELTLDTDFLVVGAISEEGLTHLTPQAKAAIAEGAKAYDEARHYYVTVLTVDKLYKYWDDAGTVVEK